MNLELLESFGQNYPEEADGVLDCISLAVTAAFNKYGTLLAVGCNDGRVVIWDFMTRGISKVITSHVHPVCSVSWSRNGRKLLTASTDNTVCIIDVSTGDSDHRFRFPSPILRIQYNPRSMDKLLVCPMRHPAMVVDVDGSRLIVPLDDEADTSISASFDRRGRHVYTGNSKGRVTVHRASDAKLVASFRVAQGAASTTAIKSIEFSRRGGWFLVNSADRIIRVYNSDEVLACGIDGEPEPIQKLQDLVNKTMWKKCCFSGDGEYVCAGSSRQHALYIWDKSNGNLVKILQGTKGELLLDVVWHPVRPIACSISSGVVSIWSQNQVENWSAFAPDFKELDENVEYDERESEFDDEDEDKIVANLHNRREDDLEVDVCKIEPIPAFCSSDEEEEDPNALLFLPIAPEVEDPDESWAPPLQEFHIASQDENHPQQPHHHHHHHSKRHYNDSNRDNSLTSPRRKKAKTHDITLEGSPVNDTHPLLSNKPHKDKSSHSKRASGSGSLHRPHSHKSSEGKKHSTQHSHRDKYKTSS